MGTIDVPFALVFMGLSAVFASFWIAPSYAAVQILFRNIGEHRHQR